MTRAYWLAAMMIVAGCSPSNGSIGAQMEGHDDYLRTTRQVIDALNRPQGPDYPAAIRIVERSHRDPLQQDYDIGNLLLASCRDRTRACSGARTARAGMARLYRVAMARGDDARIAAGDLSLWFTRGAGPALPPDPQRAACWTDVHAGKSPASRCPAPGADR